MAFAQSLSAGNSLRPVLLYLAPSASLLLGVATYYLELLTSRYLQGRVVSSVRKRLESYLNSPYTSDEHKARIRRQLEELEVGVAVREVERVRTISRRPSVELRPTESAPESAGDV